MSLQLWLPLNGDITNHGVGMCDITSSNLSFTDGKIGKAASFSSSFIGINNTPITGDITDFSIVFWFKTPTPTNTMALYNGRTEIGGPCAIFTIDGSLRFDDGTQHNALYTIPNNTWNHYCITRNSEKINLYVDGKLVNTVGSVTFTTCDASKATIGMSSVDTITGENNPLNGQLNDYRIYDHCLSTKEVIEISKGLVLHYPMNDGSLEPTTNLVSKYETGWDNTGTSTKNWNDTSYENVPIADCKVYSFDKPAVGESAIGFGMMKSPVLNQTYACSVYVNVSGDISTEVLYMRSERFSDTIGILSYKGSTNPQDWPKNKWIRVSGVVKIGSEETGMYFCRFSKNVEKWAFNGWQIENKNHVTPYTSSSRKESIVYDISGFGNNGYTSINETPPEVIEDSVRYDGCTFLNGSNVGTDTKTGASYIAGKIQLPVSKELTISWWGKITKYSRGGFISTTSNTSNFEDCIDYNTTALNCYEHSVSVSNGTSNVIMATDIDANSTWHMHTVVFDGTNVIYYVDGVEKNKSALSGAAAINGIVLGLNRAGGVYRQTQQYVSDFRIYVTALNPKSIVELFNSPIHITDMGDIILQGGEVLEDSELKITKTGNVGTGEIVEPDEFTNVKVSNDQITSKNFIEI